MSINEVSGWKKEQNNLLLQNKIFDADDDRTRGLRKRPKPSQDLSQFQTNLYIKQGERHLLLLLRKKEEEAEIQPGLKSNDSAAEEATEEGLNTSFDRRRRKEGGIRGEMRRSKYIFSIK